MGTALGSNSAFVIYESSEPFKPLRLKKTLLSDDAGSLLLKACKSLNWINSSHVVFEPKVIPVDPWWSNRLSSVIK